MYVCKPSATKQCWDILHQARCPHPVDQQGNPIDRPNLTRKRRRNSSHGTERVPRAQKKPLVLNPHHAQLEDWLIFSFPFSDLKNKIPRQKDNYDSFCFCNKIFNSHKNWIFLDETIRIITSIFGDLKIQVVQVTSKIWDVQYVFKLFQHFISQMFQTRLVNNCWISVDKISVIKKREGSAFYSRVECHFIIFHSKVILFWSHIKFWCGMIEMLFSQQLMTNCWQKFNVLKKGSFSFL